MPLSGDPDKSRVLRQLDWNLMKVFAEIARAGGVSRAAELMSRQQPSVSGALKRLEEHLGVVLCRRGPGGFALTDEGRIVAEICHDFELSLGRMIASLQDVSGDLFTRVRVVTVSNLVAPQLDSAIARFTRRYPRAELIINVAPCVAIPDIVANDDAEIGVAPAEYLRDDLRFSVLFREQHVLVCGASHPLFGKVFADPSSLADHAFVLPDLDEAIPVRQFRERYGWGRHHAGGSLDLNEVRRLVLAGVGIALLPREFLEEDLKAARVWQLMDSAAELQDDVYLITNPASPRRNAANAFLGMVAEDSVIRR